MISQSSLSPSSIAIENKTNVLVCSSGTDEEDLLGKDGGEDNAMEEKPTEDDLEDNPEPEARAAVAARNPYMPIATERRVHELTHANFRIWCKQCCMGKGVSESHRRQVILDPVDRMPTVHSDYCVMRDKRLAEDEEEEKYWESNPKKLNILNVKDGQSRRIRAHLVPRKGVKHQPWVSKAVAENIKI